MKRRNDPIYRSWLHMRSRCNCPTDKKYYRYGARGIKVCERWNFYLNFYNDMAPSWQKGLSIERIDNDGDYDPANCTWATSKQQALNRSTNTHIEINGITRTLTEWAEYYGLRRSTVSQRYYVYKWSPRKSLGLGD